MRLPRLHFSPNSDETEFQGIGVNIVDCGDEHKLICVYNANGSIRRITVHDTPQVVESIAQTLFEETLLEEFPLKRKTCGSICFKRFHTKDFININPISHTVFESVHGTYRAIIASDKKNSIFMIVNTAEVVDDELVRVTCKKTDDPKQLCKLANSGLDKLKEKHFYKWFT